MEINIKQKPSCKDIEVIAGHHLVDHKFKENRSGWMVGIMWKLLIDSKFAKSNFMKMAFRTIQTFSCVLN